jgi:hypothetical protein
MAERYWVGNTGGWNDTSHWSATSGGAGGASVPGPDDDVIIDESSFSLAGQYIIFPIEATLELTAIVAEIEAPITTIISETPVIQDGLADLTVPVPTLELVTHNFNYIGICTVSCPAEPCVVTYAAHGLVDDDCVKFIPASGVIANEINNDYAYYVKRIDANTFWLMVIPSGEVIDTTGTQTAVNIKLYKKI